MSGGSEQGPFAAGIFFILDDLQFASSICVMSSHAYVSVVLARPVEFNFLGHVEAHRGMPLKPSTSISAGAAERPRAT